MLANGSSPAGTSRNTSFEAHLASVVSLIGQRMDELEQWQTTLEPRLAASVRHVTHAWYLNRLHVHVVQSGSTTEASTSKLEAIAYTAVGSLNALALALILAYSSYYTYRNDSL